MKHHHFRRELHTWVWDGQRLIVKPSFGFHCIFVDNLVGSILVPISRLKNEDNYIWEMYKYSYRWNKHTFDAEGSGILACSTQSSGFLSSGSSISFDGLTGGSKSSSKLPFLLLSPLKRISNVLSGLQRQWETKTNKEVSPYLTMRVYRLVNFAIVGRGVSLRCFSSNSPVLGFLCRKMKWTYKKKTLERVIEKETNIQGTFVPGQVKSGPNITTQGVVSENSLPLVWNPSSRSLT